MIEDEFLDVAGEVIDAVDALAVGKGVDGGGIFVAVEGAAWAFGLVGIFEVGVVALVFWGLIAPGVEGWVGSVFAQFFLPKLSGTFGGFFPLCFGG